MIFLMASESTSKENPSGKKERKSFLGSQNLVDLFTETSTNAVVYVIEADAC